MQNISIFEKDGMLPMLAFDHRGSFEKAMKAAYPDTEVTLDEMIALKQKIIASVETLCSGMLIDQDMGLPAYKKLNCQTPFLLPMEKTGYTDEAGERLTELMYSPESLQECGAQGAKVLLYSNHNLPSWEKQLATAQRAIESTQGVHLPLFLEFVNYDANGIVSGTVVENVKTAIQADIKPTVWKVAYPGSREECRKMTEICSDTRWVVLTGGGTFEEFVERYQIAVEEGARGFLAGRALWAEACDFYRDKEKLEQFLSVVLPERFRELVAIGVKE
jgi:tagatose-1,6-bisphosphate aldolase